MNKSNGQRYYLVNGIQGLKLNSQTGSATNTRQRPSSSRVTSRATSRNLSRPSTAGTSTNSIRTSNSNLAKNSQVLEDNCDADVTIHVFDENKNGTCLSNRS